MGFRYQIHPQQRLGIAAATGRLKGVDLERMARAICSDPAWKRGFSMLWDCTGITELVLDIQEVDGIAQAISEFCPQTGRAKAAILTLREIDYSSARLIALWGSKPCCEIRVFKCPQETAGWLEISVALVEQA